MFWECVEFGYVVGFRGTALKRVALVTLQRRDRVQATLATLLMVTAGVMLSGIVITYAVTVMESTLQTDNIPQLDRLRNLQSSLLNQTKSVLNQTATMLESSAALGP